MNTNIEITPVSMMHPMKAVICVAIILIRIQSRQFQNFETNTLTPSRNIRSTKNVFQRQMRMKEFFKTIMLNQADILIHTFKEKNQRHEQNDIRKFRNGKKDIYIQSFLIFTLY